MKRRTLFVTLAIITVLGFLSIPPILPRDTEKAKAASEKIDNHTQTSGQEQVPDPPGTIDGAINPELISDQAAYMLLFRLLSNRHTPEGQAHARSYLRMAFGCGSCGQGKKSKKEIESEDVMINVVLAVVDKFEKRVGVLDRQAKDIWGRNGPNLDSRSLARLNDLQRRKEEIVTKIVASLSDDLGVEAKEKLSKHVNERVKRKVKVTPTHIHT